MSPSKSYRSRTGEVPCGDKDLYAFMTDLRNFKEMLPQGIISGWEAATDECSFTIDKAGRVKIRLKETLPHSIVSYAAENLFAGKLSLQVVIEPLPGQRSKVYVTVDINMNPLVSMLIKDDAPKYLDRMIDMIENYKGYDRIRGYSQSL